MAIGFSTAVRDAQMQAIVTAAGNGAILTIRSGTRPATGGAPPASSDLADLVCGSPLGTVSTGVLTFNAVNSDPSANRDGTATWARLTTSAAVFVADFSVGLTGSGADIEVNNTAISTGQQVDLVSGTITAGNV